MTAARATGLVVASCTRTAAAPFDKVDDFFVGGITGFKDLPHILQGLAGIRMVQVEFHLVLSHLCDTTHETVADFVFQRHEGSLVDVFVVEMTVNDKFVSFQFKHGLRVIFSECFVGGECEVELIAGLQVDDLSLKLVEHQSEATDEALGLLGCCHFGKSLLIILNDIKFIRKSNQFVFHLFHIFLVSICKSTSFFLNIKKKVLLFSFHLAIISYLCIKVIVITKSTMETKDLTRQAPARRNIYFAGSIRGGRVDADLYRRMIAHIQLSDNVLTEHVGSQKLCLTEQGRDGDASIYQQDTTWLRQSDLLIGECTCPSLGVGYELAYAERFGIPCHLLYDRTKTQLSAMLNGDPYFHIYPYSHPDEVIPLLDKILRF